MAFPLIPLSNPAAARMLAAGALALGLTAAALPGTGLGQEAPAPRGDAPHHHKGPRHGHALLSVTGEGQAHTAPDIAHVSVGVSTRAETAAEAMSENAALQQAVIDQLLAEGLEERDIQTTGLNLSPIQDHSNDGQPPVVTGYAAHNMVSIRVRDIDALGPVLDRLVETGANEINSISFSREDMTEAENEARTNAIASAQERAEVMAAAAGKRLGRLVSLSDSQQIDGPRPVMMQAMARAADASTPVQAGELSVSARVSATYLLLDDETGNGADGNGGEEQPE